mmetsp:Transcript_39129/g.70508  ORF Transcript_39129/g.70508 Transcript_39129/m.70508 type:complete len:248 (+) Transcript_39129:1115-1858(+)
MVEGIDVGWSDGSSDGRSVGLVEGNDVGRNVLVGWSDGLLIGMVDIVGKEVTVGVVDGISENVNDGLAEKLAVGLVVTVGDNVGIKGVDDSDGSSLGDLVGEISEAEERSSRISLVEVCDDVGRNVVVLASVGVLVEVVVGREVGLSEETTVTSSSSSSSSPVVDRTGALVLISRANVVAVVGYSVGYFVGTGMTTIGIPSPSATPTSLLPVLGGTPFPATRSTETEEASEPPIPLLLLFIMPPVVP